MLKTIAIIAACVAVAAALPLTKEEAEHQFTAWMSKYEKSYVHDEFASRFNTFKSNLEFILNHDEDSEGFAVELNEFADLGDEEFEQLYMGYIMPKAVAEDKFSTPFEIDNVDLADTVDWLSKGAVTPVKNQGQCGSCWAFSATGSMEGQNFLTGDNKLVGESEKQLMDCSGSYGNYGCNGGLMDNAFRYVIATGGIDSEESYPYVAQDGQCKYDASNVVAKFSSFTDVPSGSESGLEKAITQQPVSVAIDASGSGFRFYKSGVYKSTRCSSRRLNHGVLAVGYGANDAGEQYYTVKNSWGLGWGNKGYILMARNSNNQCGIATAASYPVV